LIHNHDFLQSRPLDVFIHDSWGKFDHVKFEYEHQVQYLSNGD